MPGSAPVRFRLVSDDSGHSYALPVGAFWPSNDSDFEFFGVPGEAVRIDGAFTFADPRSE